MANNVGQKTNFDFYTGSPEFLARLLASAYISGFTAAKEFTNKQIDKMVEDNSLVNTIIKNYIISLNEPHYNYLGIVD